MKGFLSRDRISTTPCGPICLRNPGFPPARNHREVAQIGTAETFVGHFKFPLGIGRFGSSNPPLRRTSRPANHGEHRVVFEKPQCGLRGMIHIEFGHVLKMDSIAAADEMQSPFLVRGNLLHTAPSPAIMPSHPPQPIEARSKSCSGSTAF